MKFKQVEFQSIIGKDSETETYGGIACYKNGALQYVICGCCGGTFEPDEVNIIQVYDNWINISEEIVGT